MVKQNTDVNQAPISVGQNEIMPRLVTYNQYRNTLRDRLLATQAEVNESFEELSRNALRRTNQIHGDNPVIERNKQIHGDDPVIDPNQPSTSKDTVHSRKVVETYDEALKAANDLLKIHASKQSEKHSDDEEWVIDETPVNDPPVAIIHSGVRDPVTEQNTDVGSKLITEENKSVDAQPQLETVHDNPPECSEKIVPEDTQIHSDLGSDDHSPNSFTTSQIESIIEAEAQNYPPPANNTLVSASITLSSDSDSNDKIIFPDDPSDEFAESVERAMVEDANEPAETKAEEQSPDKGHLTSIKTYHARSHRKRNRMVNLRKKIYTLMLLSI